MATTVSFNGSTFSVPATGERSWGVSLSNYLVAIASGTLQKTGGSFTLSAADVDFGASYGLKAVKFASRNTPSTAGIFRLGNNESVGWRNQANDADLLLKVNTSNIIEFNGNPLVTLALGAADTVLRMNGAGTAYEYSKIVNANIDNSAAIARSKIAAGTASHVVINDGSGNLSSEATLSKSRGGAGADMTNVTFPTTGNIATREASETFSGVKTFDEALTVKQVSTPSSPSAGYNKVYAKTDGLLYKLDSAGNEVLVGSGAGSGEINIVVNPNGDTALDGGRTNDVGDWIDSGAGTVSSKTTTAAEIPLYPVKTNAIKIVNGGSGTDYTRMRMTLPPALYNRKLKIAWEQLVSISTAYAAGDYKLELYYNASADYSGAYTAISLSTDSSGITSIPAASGRFQTSFDTTEQPYLELRITRTAGTANSFIVLNDVVIGPGIQPQGAVVTEWKSYPNNPVIGSTTTPTYSENFSYYRRVGSSLEYNIYVNWTSANKGSGNYYVALPTGLTPDSSAVAGSDYAHVGDGSATINSVTYRVNVALYSKNLEIYLFNDTVASNQFTDGDHSAGTAFVRISGSVPIAEWAGSGTVNLAQNDVEYASTSGTWDADSSTTVYGPAGVIMGGALTSSRNKTVTWITPAQRTDSQDVEFSYDQLVWFSSAVYAPYTQSSLGTDATSAGIQISNVTSTTTQVRFMRYRYLANDDSPATDWPASGLYWRVVKRSAGAAVGFGKATSTSNGLITTYAPTVKSRIYTAGAAASYTILDNDGYDTFCTTSGASTFTLPSAANNAGRKLTFKNTGTGTLAISGTIDGGTSNNTINAQYGYATVFSNGTSWFWETDIQEYGTWTPTLGGSSADYGSVTYSSRSGSYVRSGRLIIAVFDIRWSAISGGSPSGNAVVKALPYTSSGYHPLLVCEVANLACSSGFRIDGRAVSSSTTMEIIESDHDTAAATAILPVTFWATGSGTRIIKGQCSYRIAQ